MDECLTFYPVQDAGVYIPTSAPDEGGFFFLIYCTLKYIHDRTVLPGRRHVKN